jgi:hypothetical protein
MEAPMRVFVAGATGALGSQLGETQRATSAVLDLGVRFGQ